MFIAELGTGVSTDLEGKFRFTGTKGTEYTLNVSYLNHVDKEVKVKAGSPEPLVIVLEEQSYELAEVVVMADYKKNHRFQPHIAASGGQRRQYVAGYGSRHGRHPSG